MTEFDAYKYVLYSYLRNYYYNSTEVRGKFPFFNTYQEYAAALDFGDFEAADFNQDANQRIKKEFDLSFNKFLNNTFTINPNSGEPSSVVLNEKGEAFESFADVVMDFSKGKPISFMGVNNKMMTLSVPKTKINSEFQLQHGFGVTKAVYMPHDPMAASIKEWKEDSLKPPKGFDPLATYEKPTGGSWWNKFCQKWLGRSSQRWANYDHQEKLKAVRENIQAGELFKSQHNELSDMEVAKTKTAISERENSNYKQEGIDNLYTGGSVQKTQSGKKLTNEERRRFEKIAREIRLKESELNIANEENEPQPELKESQVKIEKAKVNAPQKPVSNKVEAPKKPVSNKVEAPKKPASNEVVRKPEEPKENAPQQEEPKEVVPNKDEPKVEAPAREEHKAEAPKKEELKVEESKQEEPEEDDDYDDEVEDLDEVFKSLKVKIYSKEERELFSREMQSFEKNEPDNSRIEKTSGQISVENKKKDEMQLNQL